jgi:hypothetical protein
VKIQTKWFVTPGKQTNNKRTLRIWKWPLFHSFERQSGYVLLSLSFRVLSRHVFGKIVFKIYKELKVVLIFRKIYFSNFIDGPLITTVQCFGSRFCFLLQVQDMNLNGYPLERRSKHCHRICPIKWLSSFLYIRLPRYILTGFISSLQQYVSKVNAKCSLIPNSVVIICFE